MDSFVTVAGPYRHARTMGVLQGEPSDRASASRFARRSHRVLAGTEQPHRGSRRELDHRPIRAPRRRGGRCIAAGLAGLDRSATAGGSAIRRGRAISTSLAPEFRPFASRHPGPRAITGSCFSTTSAERSTRVRYRVRGGLETILTRFTSEKDVDAGELVTATVNPEWQHAHADP